jgi:hypothetical protein
MSEVDRPALASAARMTRCWDGPFGAVRPFDAPSEFTAEPRTVARIGCPSRSASERRASTSMPTPSDQPVPSASSENALHSPSGARPPWMVNPAKLMGVAITVAPPTSARSHSPPRNACAAQCMATSEDEHAVSTVTAGPSNPKV